jgi:hypothetical protein
MPDGSDGKTRTYVPSDQVCSLFRKAVCGAGIRTPISRSRAVRISIIRPRIEGSPRIAMGKMRRPASPQDVGPSTRDEVRRLLGEGLRVTQVARQLGISTPTACYHARKLGIPASTKYAPRDDWPEIQHYYDQGHSLRECEQKFGFSRRSWGKAVARGDIVPRAPHIPLGYLLVAGPRRNRTHIERRLLSGGLKEETHRRLRESPDPCPDPPVPPDPAERPR